MEGDEKAFTIVGSVLVIGICLLIGQCGYLSCATPERMCIFNKSGHDMTECLDALGDSDEEEW